MTNVDYPGASTESISNQTPRCHPAVKAFDKAIRSIRTAGSRFEQAAILLPGPESNCLLRLAESCQAALPSLARIGRQLKTERPA